MDALIVTKASIFYVDCMVRANSDIEIGSIFGSFRVVGHAPDKHEKVQFACACILCETSRDIAGYDLKKGRIPRCKGCIEAALPEKKRAEKARYYQKHREKIRERQSKLRKENPISTSKSRNYNYKSAYGIDEEDYAELYKSQEGKCKICGVEKPLDGIHQNRLCVDHCHETGNIRGLLCFKCNTGLGKFCDNPSFLRAAAEYLEKLHA